MTEQSKDIEKKIQVYQSNDLVEAIYEDDLSATEHKIIRYAAGKITNSPNQFPDVSFTVSEFVKAAGLNGQGYYSRVEKLADELTKKRIKIHTVDNDIGWFPWFKSIIYRKGSGVVDIQFNDVIQPYIMNLTQSGRYTKYDFPTIGEMQSPYTIRLFELLQQYAKIGKRTIKVETLKEHLGVGGKYKQYGHFKSRILLKVQEELNEINVLTFEFEEIKKGRKVDEIKFTIRITDIPFEGDIKEEEVKAFIEQARPLVKQYGYDIPNRELKAWTSFGIDELQFVLEQIEKNNTKVTHIGAYITTILKSRYKEYKKTTSNFRLTDENVQDIIWNYIKNTKNNVGVLPEGFIEQKLLKEFEKQNYTYEQFQEIWKENSKMIYKAVNNK
ncbi:replication initiation protein [Oceanobacillus kimchii]|uniref:Initiator Rep protein WH1 domain-containing protein n=1 Tax=Oceanobacillus kimchii TaxID=746691 RepID=A0ABQ5TQF9_9BACI|nr:replication initiation protein [Oceanobacillus kimchii]GLO68477.1 hypothetical protein MACH08_42610 [Oceanobacillus kimchii]